MPAGLILVHFVISGCSYRQQVDLSQWREYRGTTEIISAKESSRPLKARANLAYVRLPKTMMSRATDTGEVVQSVEAAGRGRETNDGLKDIRPWPKRGTPEFEKLQAEEVEQENRVKAAIQSICRGC